MPSRSNSLGELLYLLRPAELFYLCINDRYQYTKAFGFLDTHLSISAPMFAVIV